MKPQTYTHRPGQNAAPQCPQFWGEVRKGPVRCTRVLTMAMAGTQERTSPFLKLPSLIISKWKETEKHREATPGFEMF